MLDKKKKEKDTHKEEGLKSKALRASSSRSSRDEPTKDNYLRNEGDSDDEEMRLFVRKYN